MTLKLSGIVKTGEFLGEDAASPTQAVLRVEAHPLTGVTPPDRGTRTTLDGSVASTLTAHSTTSSISSTSTFAAGTWLPSKSTATSFNENSFSPSPIFRRASDTSSATSNRSRLSWM